MTDSVVEAEAEAKANKKIDKDPVVQKNNHIQINIKIHTILKIITKSNNIAIRNIAIRNTAIRNTIINNTTIRNIIVTIKTPQLYINKNQKLL